MHLGSLGEARIVHNECWVDDGFCEVLGQGQRKVEKREGRDTVTLWCVPILLNIFCNI